MDIKTQVEKQIENPDWDKINATVEQKKALLGDIMSAEGLMLVSIQELYPDFKMSQAQKSGNEIKARLINKTKPRIITSNSKKQTIRDVYLATEDTGVLQATLWGKLRVELFKDINHNDPILVKDVKIGEKNGETVINFFDNSTVEKIDDTQVKPLSDMLESINYASVKKSRIGTLKGLIIEVKDIEYKTCPHCNGKVSEVEDTFICETHNEVPPETHVAKEITFDSGKGIVSTVLWPDLLEEHKIPKQFDKIESVCRVYDKNYFARENARKNTETTEEILMKQYKIDLRLTVYSYNLEPTGIPPTQTTTPTAPTAPTTPSSNPKDAVPVEQL